MISLATGRVRSWCAEVWSCWDRFFFTPTDAATLAVIRIFTGGMLFYTHFVWWLELDGFFGPHGWLSKDFAFRFHDSPFGWSHLYWLDDTPYLGFAHVLALVVYASLTVGYRSRVASVLSYLLTVSYAHRAGGSLFGLDQINGVLALYLTIGPCGDAYSIDSWLRQKAKPALPGPSVSANLSIRLIQIHLCVVYLFAGIGKLLGESWWDGTALWGAFANQEYQTLDMTWLAGYLVLVNLFTHLTLFWEVSYIALIWPRLTRPIVLFLAIPLHMGIALCMGMITFGIIMLVANLAFVSPRTIRRIVNWALPRRATSSPQSQARLKTGSAAESERNRPIRRTVLGQPLSTQRNAAIGR